MRTDSLSIPNLRLKQARKLRGWSQKFVAEQINALATCYLSRWECGITIPSPFYREKLCTLFHMDADELGFLGPKPEETKADSSTPSPPPALLASQEEIPCLPETISPFGHPTNLIGRSNLLVQLKQQLCSDRLGVVTILYGLPGVGKTALAVEFILQEEVAQHFADGVIWTQIGQQPDFLALLSACGEQVGLTTSELSLEWVQQEDLGTSIRSAIGTRHMLIVIDDVWKVEDILVFLELGGPYCSYLITTRLPSVALHPVNTSAFVVPELNKEDSQALLAHFIPTMNHEETSAVYSLVPLVGGLPLALTMIGKHLQMHVHSGQPRRLQAALNNLRNSEKRLQLSLPRIFLEQPAATSETTNISLYTIIDASIEYLDSVAQLALSAIAFLPSKPRSFSEKEALSLSSVRVDTLDTLLDAGLLEGCGPGWYMLHRIISEVALKKQGKAVIDW